MTQVLERGVNNRVAILGLLILASMLSSNVGTAHANQIYSDNIVTNPGFESPASCPAQPSQIGQWVCDVYDDGNVGSTVNVNNTNSLTGMYSARLDVSATGTSIKMGTSINLGHITLYQYLASTVLFSNLTDRADSVSLWFNLQPKFTDFAGFAVRIRALSSAELGYYFLNPNLQSQVPSPDNSTTNSEGGKPIETVILPLPPMNQWYHFVRNLKQDWIGGMRLPNGSFVHALQVNDTFQRIETDAIYYKNDMSGAVYAETAWVDDTAAYIDSSIQPPPLPPSNYWAAVNFEDINGNPVNNLVKWRIFNSTGNEIAGYVQGSPSLAFEPHTVEAYYPAITGQNPEPYLILRQRIALNTTSTIPLEIFPQNTLPWINVAFNNTLSSMKIIKEQNTYLQFNAQGNSGAYSIILNTPSKPAAIQRNNDDPTSLKWSYDPNYSVVRIQTPALGNFSIFMTPPITVPNVNFQDLTGNPVTANISWKIFDSTGTPLGVVPGQLVQNAPYTFQAYYAGYVIYSNPLTSTTTSLRLQMMPLNTQQKSYIAFNSTVNSVTILTNSQAQLRFQAVGQGPSLVVVNVPSKPISIERDGTAISNWTYNATTETVAIQTSQLGTFTITYSNPPAIPLLYIGAAIGAIVIATAGLLIRRKTRSRTATRPPPAEEPVTKQQPKSRTRTPQKGPRGRQ